MNQFEEAARINVERFLGDLDLESINDSDLFYENVYILAFDGAVDKGATQQQAQQIAVLISSQY